MYPNFLRALSPSLHASTPHFIKEHSSSLTSLPLPPSLFLYCCLKEQKERKKVPVLKVLSCIS